MLSNQPQILEVGSTPLIHIFHRWPRTRFLANLRKNKILAGSFKQLAGETGLASPNLSPSKSALPISIGQIYTYG
jgi:hypothetical protein